MMVFFLDNHQLNPCNPLNFCLLSKFYCNPIEIVGLDEKIFFSVGFFMCLMFYTMFWEQSMYLKKKNQILEFLYCPYVKLA